MRRLQTRGRRPLLARIGRLLSHYPIGYLSSTRRIETRWSPQIFICHSPNPAPFTSFAFGVDCEPSRQTCVIKRPAQQVRQAQAPRPFFQVGAVKRRALDFEDPEHVVPLAVRHTAALAIPLELGQHGILG